jgi:ribosomal protein S27E
MDIDYNNITVNRGNATDPYMTIRCWNCGTINFIYPFGRVIDRDYCINCGEEL